MDKSFRNAVVMITVLLTVSYLLVSHTEQYPVMTPEDAIRLAAEVAEGRPSVSEGTYQFVIQATGKEGENWYLNSETDYRDQRNLTITINPSVQFQLINEYGSMPLEFLLGKLIQVQGEARKIKIRIFYKGNNTRKYYYQTHIDIDDISQIKILNAEN